MNLWSNIRPLVSYIIVVGGDLGIIKDLKLKQGGRMGFFKVEFMGNFANNNNIILGMLL